MAQPPPGETSFRDITVPNAHEAIIDPGTFELAQRILAERELRQLLRTLKLGKLLDTLPERLTLAKQRQLAHGEFLELVLADEVSRRETNSAALRARAAGLDAAMRLETWDPAAAVRFDQQLWNELVSLRFLDPAHGAVILEPTWGRGGHPAAINSHPTPRHDVHTATGPTSAKSTTKKPKATKSANPRPRRTG